MALFKYIQRHGARQLSVGCRHFSDQPDLYKTYKHVQKQEKKQTKDLSKWEEYMLERPWNEGLEIMRAIRKNKRRPKEEEFSHFRDQVVMTMQRIRPLLYYRGELSKYFRDKILERELFKQSFLQHRLDVLGPDIGAAHFILNRGGRVKFWGHKEWITKGNMTQKLPCKYTPGLYIVAIDATDTGLYYEGIDCLRYLNKLKWLRLKGLSNLNDFSLDIISGRYGPQLEYLDLTRCYGITHFGLASFYRFTCLKGLNVSGLNHTPEFALSCLMLQDLLPDLNIIGLDFSQYLKDEKKEEPIIEIKEQENQSV